MAQFDSLAKQIAATNTVHGSAVALIQGIAAQLTAGLSSQPTDGGAQLRALASSLTQQAQVLATSVSANTPAGVVIPVAPPNPPNTPLTPTSYGYDPAAPMLPVTPVGGSHATTAPEPLDARPAAQREREDRAALDRDVKADESPYTTDASNPSMREAREAQAARDRRNATPGVPYTPNPNEYDTKATPHGTPTPSPYAGIAPAAPLTPGAPTSTLAERERSASAGPPYTN